MASHKLWLAFLLATLTSCVYQPRQETFSTAQIPNKNYCGSLYSSLHSKAKEEQVDDNQASTIKNFPFLSINRFLASYKNELNPDSDKFRLWTQLAAQKSLTARHVEWQNLSPQSRQEIETHFLQEKEFRKVLSQCSEYLLANLTSEEQQRIIDNISIKDDYKTLNRILGLYPLTSGITKLMFIGYYRELQELYKKSLEDIPLQGKLTRYIPEQTTLSFETKSKPKNPLNIPSLSVDQLNYLFNFYAPIIEIDENGYYDKIGSPIWQDKSIPSVDISAPTFYVLPSYARYNDKVLLQLNYVFWFSERPKQKAIDIYAGKLDGIIWRVTLDENFQPLVFDSIHSCGCYHKFFSTPQASFKTDHAHQQPEPPIELQSNITLNENQRIVLRLGTASHFINRVLVTDKTNISGIQTPLRKYKELRSLQVDSERRSLFLPNGLVRGTERPERWLLWPMGVPSAGAMRQWGHHAIAFVGRRHFDDPYLIADFFDLTLKQP